MGGPYLLAIDQGTTSSRAILFSTAGDILDVRQKELPMHYPHKGWVEQDPEDIWADTIWACQEIVDALGADASQIVAAGITNQRETTILWNRKTGQPIYNAIVWQDRRTADYCRDLKAKGHEPVITEKTGLLLDPYFSATKIAWILDNVEGARKRAEAGELAFGTVDSFLLWRLSAGKIHKTDITNASRTMLYNIQAQGWDEDLLRIFDIPQSLLPEVHENIHDFAMISEDLFGQALPVCGVAGDQQSALIGQGCFQPGMIKSTYGTGCFALQNIGSDFKVSKNKLLTTPAYKIDGNLTYALEGSIFVAGAAIQWLRDGLSLFTEAAESEALARSIDHTNGVYFVPAFTGLGAPHWQPEAKAMITGLTRDTGAAHITRAALEAQAYQTYDLFEAMRGDSGVETAIIRVDGGLVQNEFMCQFLADILNKPVEVPKITETTAWGAAVLAGLGSGVFKEVDDVVELNKIVKRYEPQMIECDRTEFIKGWNVAISQVLKGVS